MHINHVIRSSPIAIVTLLMVIVLLTSNYQVYAYDSCNFCRAPNVINNPSGEVEIIFIQLFVYLGYNGGNNVTCAEFDQLGKDGKFSDGLCLFLQSRNPLRKNCKCRPPLIPTATKRPVYQPPRKPTTKPRAIPTRPTRKPSRKPSTGAGKVKPVLIKATIKANIINPETGFSSPVKVPTPRNLPTIPTKRLRRI
jgi:hypothetical protein